MGSASVLSTILNLQMANHAVAAGGLAGSERKTLVCIFLSGGCDTYNMVVPHDLAGHASYVGARSNLALPQAGLNELKNDDALGRRFGLHPSLGRLADMFNGEGDWVGKKRLSVMTNVGTLVEPITDKVQFDDGSKMLPKALFSHRDQVEQWQTSVPQGMANLSGWAGRAADILHSTLNTEQTGGYYMPMGFSLSGNNVLQSGVREGQFVITSGGALTFTGGNNASGVGILDVKNQALAKFAKSPLEAEYHNLFEQAFSNISAASIERGEEFQGSFGDDDLVVGTQNVKAILDAADFPDGGLSNRLKAAIKTIAIRQELKLCRQTIFLEYGGWDHHSELLNTQAGMFDEFDRAIAAYQGCLETLGLADGVVSFTSSDFGRTLRSNGQGTDHAWSGNQLVFGAPVNAGIVAGTYANLAIDGPDDVGRGGRIFPRTSVDEYFAEMLRWFGLSGANLDAVLPNLNRFVGLPALNLITP